MSHENCSVRSTPPAVAKIHAMSKPRFWFVIGRPESRSMIAMAWRTSRQTPSSGLSGWLSGTAKVGGRGSAGLASVGSVSEANETRAAHGQSRLLPVACSSSPVVSRSMTISEAALIPAERSRRSERWLIQTTVSGSKVSPCSKGS